MKLLYSYIPFQILIGVFLGILFSGNTDCFYGACISVLLLSILLLNLQKYKHLGVLLILIVFGSLSARFSIYITSETLNKQHYVHTVKNSSTLELTVVKQLPSSKNQFKYYARVTSIKSKVSCGKILVTASKDSLSLNKLSLGDKFVCIAEIRPIRIANSPYDFDYRNYLKKKGIYGNISIKEYIITGKSSSILLNIQKYRDRIVNRLRRSVLSKESKGLLMAMLLGSKEHLSKELMISFRDAGVVHLIAISGMHVGVLYFILFYGFNFVKRFKYGDFLHICLVLFCMWSFAIFSGLSTSVVRSVTMFSFIILSRLKKRKGVLLEPIVSSMLFLLLIRPNYVFDVGFQLSYTAVISIVVFYPLLAKRIRIKNKIVKYFTDVVIVSLVAQLGVLPITLYYFHQIPLQFLVTNFVAVSLLPIVLYGGFIILLKIIWIQNFMFIEIGFDVFLNQYIQVIQFFSSLESFILKDVVLTEVHVYGYYLLLFLSWKLFKKTSYRNWMYLFLGIISFQVFHIFSSYQTYKKEEFLIYNTYNNQTLTIKKDNAVFVFLDSILSPVIHQNKIKNKGTAMVMLDSKVIEFKQHLFVIVDENYAYHKIKGKGMFLVLLNNPKVNLERLIKNLEPKQIIIGAGNYKNNIIKWKSTCKKLQVPFYDIELQGSYVLN